VIAMHKRLERRKQRCLEKQFLKMAAIKECSD
jgi:hypothetical protein